MIPYHTLQHFLWMGGYAAYVWPAYAIVMICLIIIACRFKGRLKRKLITLEK